MHWDAQGRYANLDFAHDPQRKSIPIFAALTFD